MSLQAITHQNLTNALITLSIINSLVSYVLDLDLCFIFYYFHFKVDLCNTQPYYGALNSPLWHDIRDLTANPFPS